MFDKTANKIVSIFIAAVTAASNVMPVASVAVNAEPDLTYQIIELYPDEEADEKVVTLDGLMPEGAEATAVDVSEEHDGIAAYDITIKDGWREYQPGEENPIKVEITDPVITENITLWHIHDNGTREQLFDFTAEDGKVSFFATGFSVYEIVENVINTNFSYDIIDKPYPYVELNAPGWRKVTDLRVLSLDIYKTNKFYISFIDGTADDKNPDKFGIGRFAKNGVEENLKSNNRTGLKVTAPISDNSGKLPDDSTADYDEIIQNAITNGAAPFEFSKNTDGTYIITSNGQYVKADKNNNQRNLRYSTSESSNWTIVCDSSNGKIDFSTVASGETLHWAPTYGGSKYGIATYTEPRYFNIWYYVPASANPTADPYALEGTPYGLVNRNGDNGYFLSKDKNNNTTLKGISSSFSESEQQYKSANAVFSGWTFHWQDKTNYLITAPDGKYLRLVNGSLSLVEGIENATIMTVVPGTGELNGKIKIVSENKAIRRNGSNFQADNNNDNADRYFDLVMLGNSLNDPYSLDGKSFGLMYYQNDAYGYTIQAEAFNSNQKDLKCLETQTKVNPLTYNYVNFVTKDDAAVTFWTFQSDHDDYYQISADTADGKKYLNITSDGSLKISDTSQPIQVIPGTGTYQNCIKLGANGKYIRYNFDNNYINGRFSAVNDVAADNKNAKYYWLNFVEDVSMLIPNDFVVYTAKKVGVAEHENEDPTAPFIVRNNEENDPVVHNEIIIYTRVWDDSLNKYRFYAVDHNGTLVECYERGDNIMWIGNQVNTLKWQFIEYLDNDGKPTNYYDLYNPYSGKYIVPQLKNGQILVDSNDPDLAQKLGINMPGRREGEYYTQFIKWDDVSYAFAGVRANDSDTAIESCKKKIGDTFYFAYFDTSSDLHKIETVDNSKYGITMKMVDFNGPTRSYEGCTSTEEQHAVMGVTKYVSLEQGSGLLSTDLVGGYPTAVNTNRSLSELFVKDDTKVVNHLFLQSTLEESGYFEYDSCQNYATLKGVNGEDFGTPSQNSDGEYLYLEVDEDGHNVVKAYAAGETPPAGAKPIYDFTVSKELGTYDGGDKPSLKHGQFLPYDDIDGNTQANTNGWNLYDALQQPLSDSDPRKYEELYKVQSADLYFGMELEASFIQTPSGNDNWNHPIIFEFTGDDDFWLYVDGELVIDLGGVHSALDGTVNFATGEVIVNTITTNSAYKVRTNLREIFIKHYMDRDGMTQEQAEALANQKFTQKPDGTYVFNEYTLHTMKIFYMERGGGASNLHMRFNISSVNPGSVMLTKKVETEGAEIDGELDENLMQFPYQIWFATKDVQDSAVAAYKSAHGITTDLDEDQIRTALDDYALHHPNDMLLTNDTANFSIGYQQSARPIRFEERFTDNLGHTFYNVYFLYPGLTAEIRFPEDTLYYKIIECGIDSDVYALTNIEGGDGNQNIPGASELPWTKVIDRPNIVYKNQVAQHAFKPLRLTKVLVDDQNQQLTKDNEVYTFRLYLTDGISDSLTLTNMYKYHVLDPNLNYCRWNDTTLKFESLGDGNNNINNLQDQIESLTFETSINGAISNIPLGYTIEVPNLPLHSYFMVEERANETPQGCKYVEFYDHLYEGGWSYENQDEVTLNGVENTPVSRRQCAGKIMDNDPKPWVNIKNQRGWELHAEKKWSDKDFVTSHANVYTAVYLKKTVTDPDTGETQTTETLLDGSIRELRNPNTDVRYYYDSLENGYQFSDYAVYEVDLGGQVPTVSEVSDEYGTEYRVTVADNSLVSKRMNDLFEVTYTMTDGTPKTGNYHVSYETGTPTGGDENVRKDTITNTRQGGLIIHLYEMGTNKKLAGGTFELKKENDDTTLKEYVSDADGLVTVMYDFDQDQNYILTETSAPKGYLGVPNAVKICVNSGTDGKPASITVSGNDTGWASGIIKPTEELVAQVDVFNPKFQIRFRKTDGQGQPLKGASFSIYRSVPITVNGVESERMDYFPVEGLDHVISGDNGIIFELSSENQNMLQPDNSYYLFEEDAPTNYIGLNKPIKFRISKKGVVTVYETDVNGTETELLSNEYLTIDSNHTYVFTVPNVFSKRDYYFDIEKIIFVDQNIHDSDPEQKFLFKVERFRDTTTDFSTTPEEVFYVTLNCNQELQYTADDDIKFKSSGNKYNYGLYHDDDSHSAFTVSGENVLISKTYQQGGETVTYSYPAAIWNGHKTVHVQKAGIYRISEVKDWSNTDYDFWTGSNIYKGYGTPIAQGQSDGYVIFNAADVRADAFENPTGTIDGNTVYRPTASFTNSETEFAYLSSQAWAENIIRLN